MKSALQALIILALLSIFALAQSPDATVTGRVLDPSNAVIPDAKVEIINLYTGVHRVGQSNMEGAFVVPNLPPGPYRIEVSKDGFKTVVREDVVLRVQDIVALNFTLPLGSISESVTVSGGAPVVNTQDAAVSTVVDRNFAENLPLNGRSFQTLIQLTPGVVLTPSDRFDSGQFSVNGQRASSNYWMVDGVSANIGIGVNGSPGGPGFAGNGLGGTLGSFSAVGGTNSLVSVDAMQEFRIQTSTFAPEFGRTPGGQISIVTRSGSNQFHGSVFEYFRNDVLDANNWFNTSVTPALPKAKERNNDFGGTLSGPIIKDHTFFFFSYEGLRLRLPQTTLGFVPDLATRQNAVSAMQPFLSAFPLPNGTDNVATGVAQLNASYSNPATLDAYSLRADHRLSSEWTVFGRYNYSPSQIELRGANGAAALSVLATSRITTQTATLGATWNIAPVLINDLRLNYSRTNAQGNNRLDNSLGAVPLSTLPFPTPFTAQNGQFALCSFVLTGGACLSAGANVKNIQRQINVVDTVSWQRGPHAFKLGVDWRHLSPDSIPLAYLQFANFSSMAGFKTGKSLFTRVSSFNRVSERFTNLGIYAQDTWRTTPRLTFTYGVRWDMDFAPSSGNGLNIAAVTGYNLLDLSKLAIAPAGTEPFATTFGNVAPRLGVAYQVFQNRDWLTVVRGGFGVFYDLVSSEAGNLLGSAVNNPPFGSFVLNFGGAFPLTAAQSQPPPIPTAPTLASLNAFNPNVKLPYTLEWNAALEQGLGASQSVSLTYVGAAGRRLLQTTTLTNGSFVDNTATSDYHALQAQFQRRLSRGFQALASYSWSHSIDDGSAGSFGSPGNRGLPSGGNRGDSAFDIRNAFSAALTYDLPSLTGNVFAGAILKGWSIENIVQARSAPPVDLTAAGFFAPFPSGARANVRPDVVLGQPFYLYGPQYPGGKAFNPAAFAKPPSGSPTCFCPARQGTLGRDVLRGFGATQWDFAVHREFSIHESIRLQFRAEMFNVLNHPNFAPPSPGFGAAGFGLSTATLDQSLNGGRNGSNVGGGAFNPLYQIGGPRSIQLALKLAF